MTTLEDLYYGNISPCERDMKRGSRMDKLVNGKRKKFNVYAETKEQCEIKLAEMIERVKAEIAEEKAKQKRGRLVRAALRNWFAVNKE